jgi:antitoxin MazE
MDMVMKRFTVDTTIQPWGNSLGLRITQPLSELAHLERGTVVTVEVVDGGLLVKPKSVACKAWVLPFSEAELVAGLTPASAHADELPTVLPSETGQ